MQEVEIHWCLAVLWLVVPAVVQEKVRVEVPEQWCCRQAHGHRSRRTASLRAAWMDLETAALSHWP